MIEVLRSGALNTIQDLGRPLGRSFGVGRAGAMDRAALRLANLLVGNAPNAAAIEVAIFPFELGFEVDSAVAVTGAGAAYLDGAPLASNWAVRVRPGQSLRLQASAEGVFGYVALAGGLDAPVRLGSRATDLKGRFGGLDGAPLAVGARLRVLEPEAFARVPARGYGAPRDPLGTTAALGGSAGVSLRVLAAAEWNAFTEAAIEALLEADWCVSRDINRTGYKLTGPKLALRQPLELQSHGIAPGVIQVPASAQPIVQMADANTCGGYPKIATVIEADLGRLAQSRSGRTVRFAHVDWLEARNAQHTLDRRLCDLDKWLRDARVRAAETLESR